MTLHKVYLSIGTNLGNRRRNLQAAILLIGERVGRVERCSSFLETEPWGFSSPNIFLNGALCCSTSLSPREVLQQTQEIERILGRTMKSQAGKYHDRIIDIDILLYDDWQVNAPDLHIPHPLMYERDFVMKPLNEIRDNQ